MRISTASQFDRSVDLIQRRQQALQASHEQLASGKRISRPSDDPTLAASAERALARDSRLEANQRGLEASRQAMAQSESALGSAVDLMQRVRELVVQAGNAAAGDANRKAIADELRGLRQQLLGIANQQDGNGGYLFAGQGGAQAPFAQGANGVVFNGAAGQMVADSAAALPMSVDGGAAWMQAPTGNGVFVSTFTGSTAADHQTRLWIDAGRVTSAADVTGRGYSLGFAGDATAGYSVTVERDDGTVVSNSPFVSGQALEFDGISVTLNGTPVPGKDEFTIAPSTRTLTPFDAIDRLAAALETPGRTGAQVAQTVHDGLRDLDSTMGNLMTMRSRLGWMMEHADGLDGRLADGRLAAQSARSAAEDLDMAQAVTEFQSRQTGYDAALKAYSIVQRMSLFEYIR